MGDTDTDNQIHQNHFMDHLDPTPNDQFLGTHTYSEAKNSNSTELDLLGIEYSIEQEDTRQGQIENQINILDFTDTEDKEPTICCLFCLNQISFPENTYSHHNPDLDPDTAAVLCQILGLNRCNDEFLDFFQNASYCEDCQTGLDQLKTHFDIVLSYRRIFLELLCSNFGVTNNKNSSKPPPPQLRRINKFDFPHPTQHEVANSSSPNSQNQEEDQIEEIHGGDEDENGFLFFPQVVHDELDIEEQDEVSITNNSYSVYGNEEFGDDFDPEQNEEDPDNLGLFMEPSEFHEPQVNMVWGEDDSSSAAYPTDFNFVNNLPSTSSSASSGMQKRSYFNSLDNPPRKKSRKAKVVVHSEVQPGVQVTTTSIQAIPDTDPQSFSCPTCFKILKNRNTYNSHKKYCQSNLEQYTCNMCGLTCQGQTHLVIHMEGVHLGLRPFSCDQCDLSFKTENALRAHHLVHKNERPFECPTCGLQFRRDADLRKHIQNVHQCLRPYQCSICNQRFKRTSHLKEHMGRKHRGEATI